MAQRFDQGNPPSVFTVAVIVGREGTAEEAEALTMEVGRLLAPLNAQGRMAALLTRREQGDPSAYAAESDGLRTRAEVEARRELHMDRVLAGTPGAADPYAAAVGETMRAHELDWVLKRNEG